MTKVPLLLLLLSVGLLPAAENSMTPDEAVAKLMKPLLEGSIAPEEQYDAYKELVRQGPDGWERLFRVLCDTTGSGDAARKIDCLWESSDMSQELVERFLAANQAEKARRASNESWALLYAGAYIRTEYRARGETDQARLDRHFAAIGKYLQRPEEVLIQIAFLRARLVGKQDFPGHRFPWADEGGKQKAALQELLEWWKKHRDDFREEAP